MPTRLTKAERQERDTKALNLRRAGAEYAEIAKSLGYSNSSHAWKAIQNGLAETKREAADSLRDLELDRLNRLQRAAWPAAMNGDEKAIASVVKVMDHRAKITGLYNVAAPNNDDAIRGALAGFLAAAASHPLAAVEPAGLSVHVHLPEPPAGEPLEAPAA